MKIEQRMIVVEIRMISVMSGVTREDKIRNVCVIGSIGVVLIEDKMT